MVSNNSTHLKMVKSCFLKKEERDDEQRDFLSHRESLLGMFLITFCCFQRHKQNWPQGNSVIFATTRRAFSIMKFPCLLLLPSRNNCKGGEGLFFP